MKPYSTPEQKEPSSLSETRCHCGQLMAILRKNGIELKCRRCKRITLIPFSAISVEHTSAGTGLGQEAEALSTQVVDVHVHS